MQVALITCGLPPGTASLFEAQHTDGDVLGIRFVKLNSRNDVNAWLVNAGQVARTELRPIPPAILSAPKHRAD